jgi:Zn-dependent protease
MISRQIAFLLRDIAVLFPALLIVFTFRGFFRALVSKLMGDDTAQSHGFLTLNPVAHIDVFGMSFILLIVFLIGGLIGGKFTQDYLFVLMILVGVRWTYTSPFDQRNFKRLKLGTVLTLLSRPIGCFFLALLFMYLLTYTPFHLMSIGVSETLLSIFRQVTRLAIFFGVISFLPLPPFDGGRLLQFLLPYSKQGTLAWLEEYSLFIFLILFFCPIVSDIFFSIVCGCGNVVARLLMCCVF